ARFISIVSLGLLGVAVPVQIQMMTHSTWQVGLSVTLTGGVAWNYGLAAAGTFITLLPLLSLPALPPPPQPREHPLKS
ncbi:enterobactin transporter EntS, partial [Escherichia coli]